MFDAQLEATRPPAIAALEDGIPAALSIMSHRGVGRRVSTASHVDGSNPTTTLTVS